MANLTNSQELLMPVAGYVAAAILLFLIGFCGFAFNLIVIITMWKDKKLWTPLNVVLFNLVMSDFMVSVLGNPFAFTSALSHRWVFETIGCICYGFIMSLLGITSITTLTVLAFERYLMIARPFRDKVLTKKRAGFMVLTIWVYSLFLTTPPLMGWGEYTHEAANISCSINWEKKSFNSMTYILYLFMFGFFLPIAVITFSYVNIIITIRRNTFRFGRVTKAETKVAYMILVMIAAFLVAWGPYAILALIIQFGDASMITPGIAVLPSLLAKSSICYNPIIYIGLNTQFRQTFRQKNKTDGSCETYALGTTYNLTTVKTGGATIQSDEYR